MAFLAPGMSWGVRNHRSGFWALTDGKAHYCAVRIGWLRSGLDVPAEEGNMDPWWWVPIGLAAWFLVALAIALCLGPVLRRSSQAQEAPGQKSEVPNEPREPPRDERQVS